MPSRSLITKTSEACFSYGAYTVIMKYVMILNDAPYGSERTYNGLRLAASLAKSETESVFVFMTGDAVGCAVAGQTTPNGYYNIERMLKGLAIKRVVIGVCGSCMDARGVNA